MKCPRCLDGQFRSRNGGYRKRTGKYTRIRKCDKCGFETKTIEISVETYEKENELMNRIIQAVNDFSQRPEPNKIGKEEGLI